MSKEVVSLGFDYESLIDQGLGIVAIVQASTNMLV